MGTLHEEKSSGAEVRLLQANFRVSFGYAGPMAGAPVSLQLSQHQEDQF